MGSNTVRALVFLLLLVEFALPATAALAHGEPVIAVQPEVVAAGAEITVTGTEMEAGEVFVITLESLSGSTPLGEATASGEGEEAGFAATFAIPTDVPPGTYLVRALTEEGETAVADLTITLPVDQAGAGAAIVRDPSGELHQLERPRTTGQAIVVVLLAAISVGLGFWLVRSREVGS